MPARWWAPVPPLGFRLNCFFFLINNLEVVPEHRPPCAGVPPEPLVSRGHGDAFGSRGADLKGKCHCWQLLLLQVLHHRKSFVVKQWIPIPNSATYYLYDRESESVSFLSNGDDKNNNWLYSFLLKINEITDQVPCT